MGKVDVSRSKVKFRPTLSQVTHVLMIVVLCVALWKLLFHGNRPFTYKSGDHIAGSIWRSMPDAKRTVVIAERAECGFCRASMPFYARLTRVANAANVEVVSVTTDDKVEHQRYLDQNKVHMDRIVQLKDTPLKVSGTPTLIVLDQSKTVLGAWVGQLAPDDQEKVLHLVKSGSL